MEGIGLTRESLVQAAGGETVRAIAREVAYRWLGLVNVAFLGRPDAADREWVMLDAGMAGAETLIVNAAAERFGEDSRPGAIVLTHGHFDHVGCLASLAERWDAPVYAHPAEHPYLDGSAAYPPGDPSVGGGLMAWVSRFYPVKPVDVAARLRPLAEDGTLPLLDGWRWLHTPGHTPGHVSLWHEGERLLLAGDAVVTTRQESIYAVTTQTPELQGPPAYLTLEWDRAKASVERLAGLEPTLLLAGHGRPLEGEAMREGLKRLAAEFDTLARPPEGRYVAEPARPEPGGAYRAV